MAIDRNMMSLLMIRVSSCEGLTNAASCIFHSLKGIYPKEKISFNFTFTEEQCKVEVLEMVRVEMMWSHKRRGDLDVWLRSPSGQSANLLSPRRRDKFSGSSGMIWKSLIHTGERCSGNWTVTVSSVTIEAN